MRFARKLRFCLRPTGPCGRLFPVKMDPAEALITVYNKALIVFHQDCKFMKIQKKPSLSSKMRRNHEMKILWQIVKQGIYHIEKDVKHRGQIAVCDPGVSITHGFIAHLPLNPRTHWMAATCSSVGLHKESTRNTQLTSTRTAVPRSLTLLSTSITSVDRWCLFLSIWLLLVWCELHFLFSCLRDVLTVCHFQSPNFRCAVLFASNKSLTNRLPKKTLDLCFINKEYKSMHSKTRNKWNVFIWFQT